MGRDYIVETDSRTHVEKLQVSIAVEEAGLTPADIEEIGVVNIGPAPFTGLHLAS